MTERNPHFEAVANAQAARMSASAAMPTIGPAQIAQALRAMPADEAYRLITQELLPDAIDRRRHAAHAMPVEGAPV
jgi:hypothetical protein